MSVPARLVARVVNIADLKPTDPPTVPLLGLWILSVPFALLPAWVISSAVNGQPLVQHVLTSLVKPRGNTISSLIALFAFPAIHCVGSVATNAIEGRAWCPQTTGGTDLLSTIVITFLAVSFFSGGLDEESGWRDLAQKRLQAKHGPLITALILWFLMVMWHIPDDLIQHHERVAWHP